MIPNPRSSYPREAAAIVALIDELFRIERIAPRGPPDDSERNTVLLKLRDDKSQIPLPHEVAAALGSS